MSKHKHRYIAEYPRGFANEVRICILPAGTPVETYWHDPNRYPQTVWPETRGEVMKQVRSLEKEGGYYSLEGEPCPVCGYVPPRLVKYAWRIKEVE